MFAKAYYRAWFLEDRPAGLDDNMPSLLASLGRDPNEVVLTKATDDSFKLRLTRAQRKRGGSDCSDRRISWFRERSSGGTIGSKMP